MGPYWERFPQASQGVGTTASIPGGHLIKEAEGESRCASRPEAPELGWPPEELIEKLALTLVAGFSHRHSAGTLGCVSAASTHEMPADNGVAVLAFVLAVCYSRSF